MQDQKRDVEESKLLDEIDCSYDPKKREITDLDWDKRNVKWDKAKKRWLREVINGVIWKDVISIDKLIGPNQKLFEDARQDEYLDGEDAGSDQSDFLPSTQQDRYRGTSEDTTSIPSADEHIQPEKQKARTLIDDVTLADARSSPQAFYKTNLWKFLAEWDKASAVKREKIIWKFIKDYTWKHPLDMEHLFCGGATLIFTRFTVGFQMAYMKRQRVPHYFLALTIFIRSMQGAEFTFQFASMGAIKYIFEIVRVAETSLYDKKQALAFLVELMQGANGPGIKAMICSVPHYLESLVDFLTMCHSGTVMLHCQNVFESLCIGNTMANVCLVSKFVMAMLPCDFNPLIQALAFKVLQSIVRLNPDMGKLCYKPLLDNLKTEDSSLLIEISELALVIIDTENGDEMIDLLIASATGIRLKEEFETWDRHYTYQPPSMESQHHLLSFKMKLQTTTRDDWEKAMSKKNRKDNYHQQAGTIFLLNHLIRIRTDLLGRLITHGIYGVSLKALGASPHTIVQVQAVKLIEALHDLSEDCSMSYYLMIPEVMVETIIETPEDCLKDFTSAICLYFRKLGRFALKMWKDWLDQVVTPAKESIKKHHIHRTSQDKLKTHLAVKVEQIYLELQELWTNPVMEGAPASLPSEDEDETDAGTGDAPEKAPSTATPTAPRSPEYYYKLGRQQILADPKLGLFTRYLDLPNAPADGHDDWLDSRVDEQFFAIANKENADKDLGGMEMALLLDAENVVEIPLEEDVVDEDVEEEELEEVQARGSLVSTSMEFQI